MFTKSLGPGKYSSALKMIGVIPIMDHPSRTKPSAAIKTHRIKMDRNKMDKNNLDKNKMDKKQTEKDDVEKAALAIIFSRNNYHNFCINEARSSSSTARWTWGP